MDVKRVFRITKVLFMVLACMTIVFTAKSAKASEENVEINSTNFPDEMFRKYVTQFDLDNDGILSEYEIKEVRNITIGYDEKNYKLDEYSFKVYSLKGIEYFSYLRNLTVYYLMIHDLDLSMCSNLYSIEIHLGTLSFDLVLDDLKLPSNIIDIDLEDTYINKLDLSNCIYLQKLKVGIGCPYSIPYYWEKNRQINTRIGLKSLDLSNNTRLQSLDIRSTNLRSIDLSNNVNLTRVALYPGGFTDVDISQVKDSTSSCKSFASEMNVLVDAIKNADGCYEFDISSISESFNPSKILEIEGGTISGKTFVFDEGKNILYYKYDIGKNLTMKVYLAVKEELQYPSSMWCVSGLSREESEVKVGETKRFEVFYSNNDGSDVIFESSDESIMTIKRAYDGDFEGFYYLVFHKPGDAKLTIKEKQREEILSTYTYSVSIDYELQKEQINEFVTRLYNVCLDRDPEEAGLSDWSEKLINGSITGVTAAYGFIFSNEFMNHNYCNECYVDHLYSAFMGRDADSEGRIYWIGLLEGGMTREEVFNGFALSAEFTAICEGYGVTLGEKIAIPEYGTVPKGFCSACGKIDGVTAFVTRLYEVCLDREPEEDGLNYWCNLLWNHETSGKTTAHGFIFSTEFMNHEYNDEDYVEYMYKAFFGRPSDAEGKNYWIECINNGYSREDVFTGFAESNEFANLCLRYGIRK